MGCSNAIFMLQETVSHFVSRGSSIFVASLDIQKAFDKVNHSKLLDSLVRANVPRWIIVILVNWYDKLVVAVRWKSATSEYFRVSSGVRQGSSLSPALFNLFINSFITDLRSSNSGCKINGHFVGAIMYADDLIILSASLQGLQRMLHVCESVSIELSLKFNCKKCTCCVIGHASRYVMSKMSLCGELIAWSNTFRYLGVDFVTGNNLTVNLNTVKRKFYAACNCILGNAGVLQDMIKLHLVESFCLPILSYATAALKLTMDQIKELNLCWNSVYRRIFGFQRWESVRVFIQGLGR